VPTIRTVACPDDLELCAICVPEDEIYTSGDFEGLPKVDDDVTPSHIFELLDETTGDVEEDNPGITDPDWAIERFED
jgi:hypothetical protein